MRTLTRHRARAYAAGLAAVLALAGCDGDGQAGGPTGAMAGSTPVASPTSSASPTPSITSAEVDPVLARIPAAARPETMDGASAFTAFYLDQLNKAFETGDPSLLEGLAAESCSRCETFDEAVRMLKANGEHHEGESLKVTHHEVLSYTRDKRTVMAEVELFAVPVVNASGKQVDKTDADRGAFVATLTFDGHWRIDRLQVAR